MIISEADFVCNNFPKPTGKFYEIIKFAEGINAIGHWTIIPLSAGVRFTANGFTVKVELRELVEDTIYKIVDKSGNLTKWIQSLSDISGMTMEELENSKSCFIEFEPNQIYVNP
jgi:hypothetical protein